MKFPHILYQLYYNSYWNIDPLTFTGYIRKSRKCVKYTSIFIKFQKGFINTRQTPEFEKKGNCVIQKQMSDGQEWFQHLVEYQKLSAHFNLNIKTS